MLLTRVLSITSKSVRLMALHEMHAELFKRCVTGHGGFLQDLVGCTARSV